MRRPNLRVYDAGNEEYTNPKWMKLKSFDAYIDTFILTPPDAMQCSLQYVKPQIYLIFCWASSTFAQPLLL